MRTETGDLLIGARSRAGLRQSEVADRAGVAQSMVSAYETGLREPTLPTLRRLLSAIGFSVDLVLEPRATPAAALSGPIGRRVLDHRAELRRALRRRGIVDAKIFGSAARGDDRPDSDLDLLVSVPAGLGVLALAGLERELGEILGAPVDLIPEEGLKEHVRRAVELDLLPL
ncbi:helix-turn-helix domain-containing protein [Rathayibacter sp. VKM Ac-2804]|jgi:predicted nucleotidyltransferase/DNA-binding XRE family transcriptional regulator|uniref:XRE family transcriptional regulator n=1 Tax=unclassified Rathayibacter TaxID=2609250 RepID=UPI00132E79BA|nr:MULTISPECIES: XRE family transcriptional regulator [unclassified Rathayibacter]NRG40640.1 XRE family transcriptional regulator [Rathayibacter sp. VKM Ac-2835]QHF23202.1 helix-turn-helix domain-containing protein [Rathayibacter sp. VKM Ac-2804]